MVAGLDDGSSRYIEITIGHGFISNHLRSAAWLLGVPWEDCIEVGVLLGKKTVLNEFVAYLDLREMVAQHRIGERAEIIATYALCGFSNFASMGVQIGKLLPFTQRARSFTYQVHPGYKGGIGGICPERQQDLARLSLSAYQRPCHIRSNCAILTIRTSPDCLAAPWHASLPLA